MSDDLRFYIKIDEIIYENNNYLKHGWAFFFLLSKILDLNLMDVIDLH